MLMINKRKKIKCVYQTTQSDCGACCVLMILNAYKYYDSLKSIINDLGIGRDGTSLFLIKKYMESLNFEVKSYKCNINGLKNINLPAILSWDNNHFVVLEKIKNNSIVVIDPASGRSIFKFNEFKKYFSGFVLSPQPKQKEFIAKPKILKAPIYFKILFKEKCSLLKVTLISLIYYCISIAIPIYIQSIIAFISTYSGKNDKIILYLSIFILIQILTTILKNIKTIIFEKQVFKSVNFITIDKLLKVPYSFYNRYSREDIMFRINSMSIVNNMLVSKFLSTVFDIGTVILMMFYLLFMNKNLFLITLGFMLFLIILMILMISTLNLYNNKFIKESNSYNVYLNKLLYSIQDIKTFGIENGVKKNLKESFYKYYNIDLLKSRVEGLFGSLVECINLTGPVIILIIATVVIPNISVASQISFYYIATTITSLVINIFSNINTYVFLQKYLNLIEDIIDEDDENNGEIVSELNNEDWNIKFKNVSFKYEKNSKLLINNINMSFNNNDVVGIFGESGTGKSTIIKLLLGLYTPTEGSIYLNNIDLNDIDKSVYRNSIGVVSQDITLFNKTIYENITLGRPDILFEDVVDICKIAQIHDIIESMPMKYSTPINNMGMSLSGGQKQRIAIARALLRKPKILILDEATNSLDVANENKIFDYLSDIKCTKIIITHKIDNIINADKIYKLESGNLIELDNSKIKLSGIEY